MTVVAALADVHGNVDALDAVLDELRDVSPDLVVLGGDVSWGPFPRETLERLADVPFPLRFVRGNADRELLEPPRDDGDAAERWLREQHGASELGRLAASEPHVAVAIDGLGDVLSCHGSPRSDEELITVQTPPERIEAACRGVAERVVVSAHTHMQFDRTVAGRRWLNPGSVGAPYEARRGAFWALLGPDVALRRTSYDVDRACRRIRRSGWPAADSWAGLLANPPAPETVIEDAERRRFAG